MIFSSASKLTMATRGKEVFQDKQIRIPLGDTDLRNDLHKLQKVAGPTGAPRFVAESDSTGHADRAWAGFLALNASDGPNGPVVVKSRRPRQGTRITRGYA